MGGGGGGGGWGWGRGGGGSRGRSSGKIEYKHGQKSKKGGLPTNSKTKRNGVHI